MDTAATRDTVGAVVPRRLLTRPDHLSDTPDPRRISVGLISTYPPTRCGIGRFAHSLRSGLEAVAPNAFVGVARLISSGDGFVPDPNVEVVFDPISPTAMRAAARKVSRHDVALLQHEYGLFGPKDGEAVADLVAQITIPLVSVLHTILSEPSPRQRYLLEFLGRSGILVVPTEKARLRLTTAYDVDPSVVNVIPHGAALSVAPPNPTPRRRLITWGLLGPGKGIERSLRALSLLNLDPPVTYDIVGQTHPAVLSRSGQDYRRSLEALVTELGLERRVRFIDRYVDDAGIQGLVARADLVVIPYDSHEQICSGVLTEAVAAGRPVVATAFPHAEELLAGGAGVVVSHAEEAMAESIRRLLTDEGIYSEAAHHARRVAEDLSWRVVGHQYLGLLHSIRSTVDVA